MKEFALFLGFLLIGAQALPDLIKIGGLFESGDEHMEQAFRLAIDWVNGDPRLLPMSRLSPEIERLIKYDSFEATRKVCDLLSTGIGAVFGPQSSESSAGVQSTADVMGVPHIESRWDYSSRRENFSVNLYPHPSALGRAFLEFVRNKEWKSFAILYQDSEALIRLQELLKDPSIREKKVIVRQFTTDEYRKLFKELNRANVKNVILDVPTEKIHTVLKHAQQVDMMSEYHNYFLTTLDLDTVDLEDFQYGGTNISAFRLIDVDAPSYSSVSRSSIHSLTTEMGLVFDAIQLFATALRDLDRGQKINIRPLSCDNEQPWSHGISLVNYMRMINIKGLTGDIKFDRLGFRSDFKLKVLELTYDGLRVAGEWGTHTGLNLTSNYSRDYEEAMLSIQNKTLLVTSILSRPYMMLKPDHNNRFGNDKYEGYNIDLMEEIAKHFKFRFVIRLVEDNIYGKKNEQGEWNGMIRELIDGKADMAVADLTITYEREEAVDFTMPFMNLGISILFKKPAKKTPRLFSFLTPLSLEVWVYMATAFMGVSLFLFIVARFSPYEWTNPHPCNPSPGLLENQFTLINTLWFTVGCLMQQGSEMTPRALSTRVVAGIWWFFTLIMVSSYTANLAAFLTLERLVSPIETAEDLAKQSFIQYGCVESGSTQAFFKDSKIPTYKRMWAYMTSARPSVFVENNDKGMERVLKGNYAFLMESTSVDYLIERNCDLIQVGGLLDSKGYGIATPNGSPYRVLLSSAILKLQETGVLHSLKDRWWKQRRGGGKCFKEEPKVAISANALSLANVGGVFVILLAGLGISCIIAIAEFVWKSRKVASEEREPLCMELCRELKFALTCKNTTKPIRKKRDDQRGGPENGLPFMPLTGYNTGKEAIS